MDATQPATDPPFIRKAGGLQRAVALIFFLLFGILIQDDDTHKRALGGPTFRTLMDHDACSALA